MVLLNYNIIVKYIINIIYLNRSLFGPFARLIFVVRLVFWLLTFISLKQIKHYTILYIKNI